jgi:hypothetical protein
MMMIKYPVYNVIKNMLAYLVTYETCVCIFICYLQKSCLTYYRTRTRVTLINFVDIAVLSLFTFKGGMNIFVLQSVLSGFMELVDLFIWMKLKNEN